MLALTTGYGFYGARMSKDWVRVILNPTAGQGRALGKLARDRAGRSRRTSGGSEILVTPAPATPRSWRAPPTARGST